MSDHSFWRRLYPGIRFKRWLLFTWVGFFFLSLAMALGLMFTLFAIPGNIETAQSFFPTGYLIASVVALVLGIGWIFSGLKGALALLARSRPDAPKRVRDLFRAHPQARRVQNPRVVTVGGGTGLSTLLKGLKEYSLDLTAVVTVTDDGGSSGQLRKDYQILPPGDIRNCLVALSRSENILSRLFQHRFAEGSLGGHSFGNLLIAAMTEVTGDFGSAVRESSNILAISGRVLPVTLDNVQLQASFTDDTTIVGESAITAAGKKISGVRITPADPLPTPEVLAAIDQAQLIVLGPGSLFTSVIPNLLVPGIAERINRSPARVVYICNVMTQPGETDGFAAIDHVKTLLAMTSLTRIDAAVINSRRASRAILERYAAQKQTWVAPTVAQIEELGIRVITGDYLLEGDLLRHNSAALAETLAHYVVDEMNHADELGDH